MLLFPAIDLMSGQVVRLRQGKADQKTVYSDDPAAFARQWQAEGGDYLHIVDLDAAFSGEQRNLEAVREMAAAISIPCQLGGGMRSREAIARALEAGVARVIIGTRAAESLEFVREMVLEFGRDRIAVGIDAKNGIVSVKGWTEMSQTKALDLARRVEDAGVGTIIYTDIATDGMLQGPNFEETAKMLESLSCGLIASGGVSSAKDVQRLSEMPGLYGCIIGKALYDGALQLRDVVAFKRNSSPTNHREMKVLYLDCFSGISGDMTVGALCDLGVKPSALEWELSKLEIGHFHMHFDRGQRQNIEGMKFSIHEGETHTHDEEESDGHHHHHEHGDHHHHHEHGHGQGHEHEHAHEHGGPGHVHHEHHHEHEHEPGEEEEIEHGHGHEVPQPEGAHEHEHGHEHHQEEHDEDHGHGHEVHHHHGEEHEHHHHHGEHCDHGHGHEHEHVHGRTHRQIRELISASDLSHFVKQHALGIFERIAVAEGKLHGVPVDDVAFHEVGALDSIADVICTCAGIEALGVEKIFVSSLHDGKGWVKCAHGTFPVPAPATLEILKGIPLGQIDEPHELITPTGAAILAEFGESFGLMPRMKVDKIGYGLGTRKLHSRPNVLRAVVGELAPE